MRPMKRSAPVIVAAMALALSAGIAPAEEASSINYVMERSVLSGGGGESSSPNYSLVATAGQGVESGNADSAAYSTNIGYLNDIDLDSDGIYGLDDLCEAQFAGCLDLDGNGCIDFPDPDGDGDGITMGQCDCNDGIGEFWGTPGEVVNLQILPLGGGSATLLWDPPLPPGGDPVHYEVLRSADASDFLSLPTECVIAGIDTSVGEPSVPVPGSALFYLLRGTNGCPAGQGTLGAASNEVLRAGRDCP